MELNHASISADDDGLMSEVKNIIESRTLQHELEKMQYEKWLMKSNPERVN